MVTEQEVEAIGRTLVDAAQPLPARFRALFTLRNLGGPAAVNWIGRAFGDGSALLKHELAFCLGQMQDEAAIPLLIQVLEDTAQEPMVRHEAGWQQLLWLWGWGRAGKWGLGLLSPLCMSSS
ncbi:deoxyhypusine hydroxylase [Empidonax traillii]|uniref:deoxyhypusine hydroxylase n=1 Tax=Empidonax traillii TaxID=164674 RepID=UPI000FFD9FEA|nr:deoxyhypusine hydroxylase [Empidonax traillii]